VRGSARLGERASSNVATTVARLAKAGELTDLSVTQTVIAPRQG
jgi:hypothetical protein